jgi:hypothetical protein
MRVEISRNELIDRLRVIQSRLTSENEHSDAIFVGFAIQVLTFEEKAQMQVPITGSAVGITNIPSGWITS